MHSPPLYGNPMIDRMHSKFTIMMSALKKAAYPLTGSVTGTASLALILPLLSVGLSQQQFSVISTVGKADP